MDKEKFNSVIGYFEEENIQLPTDVKNSIEDVFMENDDIQSVECYHKNDIDVFQKDLTLSNFVSMSLNGNNRGETNNVWTYYGNVTYSLSEAIILVGEDNEVLEEISKLENPNETTLETPNDYAVVLLERVIWDTTKKEFTRQPMLYIYCPVAIEDEVDEVDAKYQEIYNKLGL